MSQSATLAKVDTQVITTPWAFRNKIINSGFNIDQRNNGAAQTITAAAALAYTVDRWYAYCTGANVTGQQVAGSNQARKRYQFSGAASVTAIGFGTRLESINTYDLNGTTATLSVDLSNSLLTTVTWTASYANSTDTFGTLASPTKTQIATGTFTVNSSVTRYSVQIAIPSAAVTGIDVVFTVGAQTSGTFVVGNVQLEQSIVATTFEQRPYEMELSLCQRYYYRIFPNVNAANLVPYAFATTTTAASGAVQFPVTMRIAPTVLEQSGTAADYRTNFVVTATACSAVPTFGIANPNSAKVTFTVASGLTAGQAGEILAAAASSAGYLGFSAEL